MKIQEIKRYRFECSEEEVRALVEMLHFFERNADEDDETMSTLRRQFGVKGEPKGFSEGADNKEETLVEKALSQAQGKRKGRIQTNI